MMKTFVTAAAVAALLAGQAIAQTPAPTIAFVPSQAAGEVTANSIIGEKVRNGAKEDLGDVNDVVFDNEGRISAAIIGVGGFIGIGEKNVAVPFAVISRETDEKGNAYIRIDATKEQLQAAPAYQRLDKGVGVTERVKQWAAQARDKAAEYGQKAQEKASEYGQKAKEAYGDIKDRVTGEPNVPRPQQ